jgi:hypothetical protein
MQVDGQHRNMNIVLKRMNQTRHQLRSPENYVLGNRWPGKGSQSYKGKIECSTEINVCRITTINTQTDIHR